MAGPRLDARDILTAKGDRTVSVVLPALDEEGTVGDVVASVRPLLGGVVDELVVVDSGSADRTAAAARAAGARVVLRADVLPELAPLPGKGEVLWRSLAATSGDVVVFLDSDLVDPDPAFVPSLLGPLLTEAGVHLVKGFYRRPLRLESTGGGRVTELLARPVIAALRPELSGVVQPLGGEYAATREFLESVPFAAGYGVEIGLLIDRTPARTGRAGPGEPGRAQAPEPVAVAAGRDGQPDSRHGTGPMWRLGRPPCSRSSCRWTANGCRTTTVSTADRPPMRDVLALLLEDGDHPVEAVEVLGPVRHEDDAAFCLGGEDALHEDGVAVRGVEAFDGFVEDQDFGAARTARARTSRCRWPPDSASPSGPVSRSRSRSKPAVSRGRFGSARRRWCLAWRAAGSRGRSCGRRARRRVRLRRFSTGRRTRRADGRRG